MTWAGGPGDASGTAPPGLITVLLARSQQGDAAALQALFSQLYPDIKRVARARLRASGNAKDALGLSTTGLVHEGFLRMAEQEGLQGPSRGQFFAYVGQVLRSVLIDHLRAAQRDKRGGAGAVWVTLSAADDAPASSAPIDLLAIDQALTQLRGVDAGLAELIDLTAFAGLSTQDVATLRNASVRTVQRDLLKARALLGEMLL
jgi:RNA polymerase sigma factor (TIGR02999 family)